jgi:cold shock CspA family protein
MRHNGQVMFVNSEKRFGFIEDWNDGDKQKFFHQDNSADRITLQVHDLVTFEIRPSTKKPGTECCIRVRLIKRPAETGSSILAALKAEAVQS